MEREDLIKAGLHSKGGTIEASVIKLLSQGARVRHSSLYCVFTFNIPDCIFITNYKFSTSVPGVIHQHQ